MIASVFVLCSFLCGVVFCLLVGLWVAASPVGSVFQADFDCFWECATRFCFCVLFSSAAQSKRRRKHSARDRRDCSESRCAAR